MDPTHEELLPHEREDSLAVEPPRARRRLALVTLGLLGGVALLFAYQVGLVALTQPYASPTAAGGPPLLPDWLLMLVMGVQIVPFVVPALWVAWVSDSPSPRSGYGLLIGAILWLAPIYHPPALSASYPWTGIMPYLITLAPALSGGLLGGLLGDFARRRRATTPRWLVWQGVAPIIVGVGLIFLAAEAPSTRSAARVCLLAACAVSGLLAGLATGGSRLAILSVLGVATTLLWIPWRPVLIMGARYAALALPATTALVAVGGLLGWLLARVWYARSATGPT
jgi:hypothetical protein